MPKKGHVADDIGYSLEGVDRSDKRVAACADLIARFRDIYRPGYENRPGSERDVYEFERDLDRLVMEIREQAYREAQAPFVKEFHMMRDAALAIAKMQAYLPKGL